MHLRLALPLTMRAPSFARRATRDALRGWELVSADWTEDVCLVVTELVTNAVRHGGTRIGLELSLAGGCVTVVVDDGAPRLPAPRAAADDDESGRGMLIVTSLARLGVDATADGKRVWARLQLAAAASRAQPHRGLRG